MNIINVKVNFNQGICSKTGISLVQNDYNSTKMVFDFDIEEGTKILEIINSDNEIVYVGEIIDNEVVLAKEENNQISSLFNKAGDYKYEISLYIGDSKLTSAYDTLTVKQEQVVIGDKVVEPYLPVFDELMSEIDEKITEANNLNIDAEKEDGVTTITITKKDGTEEQVQILDGSGGVDDYEDLKSLPKINNVELKGNKTGANLGLQSEINNNNKLSSNLVDDTNNTNKFVTENEKNTWNSKSNFSGDYEDLTNKPTIPVVPTNVSAFNNDAGYSTFSGSYEDLTNKPTIPTVPTNVSAFNNDAGYLTQHQDISGKLDTSKVKSSTSSTSGDVYDVTYINTMLGNIETLLSEV